MFIPRVKDHIRKPANMRHKKYSMSCWSGLSKRLQNFTSYCYYPSSPPSPEVESKSPLMKNHLLKTQGTMAPELELF